MSATMIQYEFTNDRGYESAPEELPLGIVPTRLSYGPVKTGETFYSFIDDDVRVSNGYYKFQLPVEDHRPAIKETYGKPAEELVAPEGYEFTGEFRKPKAGETSLTPEPLLGSPLVHSWKEDAWDAPRLILRQIEPKANVVSITDVYKNVDSDPPEVAPKTATPAGYTASEVRERYGRNVLEIVYGHKFNQFLIDYPGFSYTGKCEWVVPGGWYLSTSGPKKHDGGKYKNHLVGTHLTMTQIAHLPRIITYALTAVSDLFENEAAYLPTESGEMVTATGSPALYLYTRSEVA